MTKSELTFPLIREEVDIKYGEFGSDCNDISDCSANSIKMLERLQ